MKLKALKLSGFKSFVDSTTISFPSNLTSIVGPNGCGKSNIMDAVRWVLGESSAKNLRSESMSDIVFNGSSSRKPVSRASVELFFDNKDGRIGGEFSDYTEISVKRTLDVDGQSNYYLNGTNCRKRDIRDVFLGTGLGPKSYAIIEQDMISSMVASKPDEMRAYIEEVAGISRYLERKKETESRIRRTKENLSRLEDLRQELGRLLLKLKQQARAANRYSELRKEESLLKGLLLASKWLQASEQTDHKFEKVRSQEIKVEEANTVKISSDSKIETYRAEQMELQSRMDQLQQEFYSKGADISRTEQDLDSCKEKLRDFESRLSINKKKLISKKQNSKDLSEERSILTSELEKISPELENLREKSFKESNTSKQSANINMEWKRFSDRAKNIIEEIKHVNKRLLTSIKQPLKREELDELSNKLESLDLAISNFSKETSKLDNQTNKIISASLESEKRERLNLLEKTTQFADLQAKLATNSSNLLHSQSEINDLESEIKLVDREILILQEPINELENKLKKILKERLQVESLLSEVRRSSEECSEKIRKIERDKIEKEQNSVSIREELEKLRLDHQASKIESENIETKIKENGQDLHELLSELSEEQNPESLLEDLVVVERKISRLGAINLAAMEEYSQEEERKMLLDKQHEELSSAIETLQNAIKKIDRETRTTFKDTFDSLNKNLTKSFPKLFGGGHAELVLLGEDLLTAGVVISAQPPGKRNSTVAQLSGGEKALSAIALVFAFFELNPAPFCLLDEVDAPLDDLNTMRFIDLVEGMSEKIQFVYITHNKISMERSKYLMGVTMQEPGVSRLVAVDVEEAVRISSN